MTIDELLVYIFEGKTHDLATQFAAWVMASARFKAFAETYRDKIRKKIRGIRDEQGLRDLQFELEVAFLLLQERHFAVEYEKGGVGKQRGADFHVTFRTRIPFNVEVKHIRFSEQEQRSEEQEFSKIVNTACQKIGQLAPGMINLLVVTYDTAIHGGYDVVASMSRLRLLAEQRDDAFFLKRGFEGSRDFLKQFQRLSAVLFRSNHVAPGQAAQSIFWPNALARPRLPADLRRILEQLGASSG